MDTKNLPVINYTPESQMRSPLRLIFLMLKDLKSCRELAWRLFIRDISARYRQSILGVFWAFLPPIVTGLIFIILQSKKVVNLGETNVPYPVFVLIGTTIWQVFVDSINAPIKCTISAKPLLAKINFPREALIVSSFYQIIFDLLIKIVVLIGIFIFFKVQVTSGLLYLPIAFLMLIILGMAIGLFLTPIGTLYRDIGTGLTIVLRLWFFVTPVVYPPLKTFPYSLLATWNPVSPILVGARDLATKGELLNFEPFLVVSCLSLLGLFVSWIIFKLTLPIIIERMSA